MQTIQLKVNDDSLGVVMTLLDNLKKDIVKEIKVIHTNNSTDDKPKFEKQNKLDQVKGILKNRTQSDVIENKDEKLDIDPYFYARQKELHQIRDDIKNGNMEMLSEEQYEQEIEQFFKHIEK